jgi:membrane-bound serine protease (ClpP class)
MMRISCGIDRGWMRRLATAALAALAIAAIPPARATQARPIVHVVPIEGMIDLGLAPFLQRVLTQAGSDGAAAVVLQINTFGGRLDAAVTMRDALLASPVRTVAFIDRRGISAGALISLAAERIAMADGGTIGAATPVQIAEPGGPAAPVEEKSVSYVRKEFRATAEARNRPLLVAEAMVDADVEIPGLIEKGKLLTLTTDEALAQRVADFRANSLDEVLAQLGLAGADVRRASPNWAERLVRLITNPILSSLLLSVAMLGILIEIRTPGFGVPGALGIASLALVLGGHWLVELAGWEEVLLIGAGLALIALEVFVIPGFGIAGVAGIVAVLAGLTLSFVGAGATAGIIGAALARVVVSAAVAVVASIFVLRLVPRLPFGRSLTLDTALDADEGYASTPATDAVWLGRVGRTISPLRPAGFDEIDGQRIDVVSEGELIESGAPVVVARVDGNRIVVRRTGTST